MLPLPIDHFVDQYGHRWETLGANEIIVKGDIIPLPPARRDLINGKPMSSLALTAPCRRMVGHTPLAAYQNSPHHYVFRMRDTTRKAIDNNERRIIL
jgi:hypothetical protein